MTSTRSYTHRIKHLPTSGSLDSAGLLQLKDTILKRAHAYFKYGDYTSAAKDAAYLQGDQNKKALKLLASCKAELGDWPAAFEAAKELPQLDSRSAEHEKLHDNARARLDEQVTGRYDFASMIQQSKSGDGSVNIATYAADIEKRKSPLGGFGMFAKCSMPRGSLILCEKAFAVARPGDATPSKAGMKDILQGQTTSSRKLVLLQKMSDRYVSDPVHSAEVLSLFSNSDIEHATSSIAEDASATATEASQPPGTQHTPAVPVFDIRKALRIIEMNAHMIFPGPGSYQHEARDPSHNIHYEDLRLHMHAPEDRQLGLWLKASLCNHSCLPNASWSWVGDALILRAIKPIAADEEITIAYTNDTTTKRQEILAGYGFKCNCALCQADEGITAEQQQARSELQESVKRWQKARLDARFRRPLYRDAMLFAISDVLDSYSCATYFDKDIPAPGLVEPLIHAAHSMLGCTANDWKTATSEHRGMAGDILRSVLAVGLQIYLVEDRYSPYCALVFGPHAVIRPAGILALVNLAELAHKAIFNAKENRRAASLMACAKELYLICYGEDATFKDKNKGYMCNKHVEPMAAAKPDEKKCMDLEANVKQRVKASTYRWIRELAVLGDTTVPAGWDDGTPLPRLPDYTD